MFEPLPLPAFRSRVVPVIVIQDVQWAVPLAHALLAGGIDVMEITLRHEQGLAALEAVARAVPEMCVGAGTVLSASELQRVQEAGAQFALSPGLSLELVQAAHRRGLPYMPGVMTPSEVMAARQAGVRLAKLFPASQVGGVGWLKAVAGPLSDMRFCPTGGVSPDNLVNFLSQPNVSMVGGSWLTPLPAMVESDWAHITQLARAATQMANAVPRPAP